MNTLKTRAIIPDQIGYKADMCDLMADVLEPSPRYTASPLESFGARSTSARTTDAAASLTELRLPRTSARIGFREFLD